MIEFKSFLKVIDLFRAGKIPNEIAKSLGMSKQQFSRDYMKDLKKYGVVERIGYAVWKVNDSKVKLLAEKIYSKSVVDDNNEKYEPDTIRAHGFEFKLVLPKRSYERDRRRILKQNNIKYEEIGSNWKGESFEYNYWTVWFTSISIRAWFTKKRGIYGDDAEDLFLEACNLFKEQVIKPLETMFNTSFQKRASKGVNGYEITTSAEHYALIKNAQAMILRHENKKLYVYGEDGKLWLIADTSLGDDELEAIKNGEARTDIQKVKDNYNSIKATGMTFHDVLKGFEKNNVMMNQLIADRNEYAENIKTHIGAIKQLGSSVEVLGKSVKQLTNIIGRPSNKNRINNKLSNDNLKNYQGGKNGK